MRGRSGARFPANVGIWLVIVGVVRVLGGWNMVVGRLAEMSAMAIFAWHTWPRIKPTGK